MYEFLSSFKHNPTQNCNNNSSILKNPKKISKTPEPRFQNMKCMKNERLEAYREKKILKKLEETLRNKIGVRWECLGKKNERAIEREIEENDRRVARGDYIGPQ